MIKDKNGRNFIPVAEDYIRKGLLDEAIDLLKEGVERYPGYLSARVSLGKAYLEKGLINEAGIDKINKGVLLVELNKSTKVVNVINRFKAEVKEIVVWTY
jgi:hypothetical protein